jgi:hypothetical protein
VRRWRAHALSVMAATTPGFEQTHTRKAGAAAPNAAPSDFLAIRPWTILI